MSPRILVVEHEAICPPALLDGWLTDAGATLTVCRPWAGEALPPLREYDGWLVLGGSVGAHDDERAPWLPEVRDRIAEAADSSVPLLGVCLGHQLAAVATGGEIALAEPAQRVGLYEIGWLDAAAGDPLMAALAHRATEDGTCRAAQWNSDVVSRLPAGAELLAAMPDGEVQAVRFAPTVWGVQWHPEVDVRVLASWADGDRDDHLERGIDQAAVLASIEAAADELAATWRPLATAFVELVAR